MGALTLDPTFDKDTREYSATTENNTNTVTATASEGMTVEKITANGEEIESGDSVTWEEGENEVVITVDGPGYVESTYTVTVTKTTPEPPESDE